MWSKTKTTYTDDTFVESNPVCITGGKGEDGKDGKDCTNVDVLLLPIRFLQPPFRWFMVYELTNLGRWEIHLEQNQSGIYRRFVY